MFCRKCGKEIPDDSEFCPKCGTVVGKEITEHVKAQADTVVADTANTTPNETTVVNETSSDTVIAAPSAIIEDKPDGRKKKAVIPFVVIAIVVVVFAAIFIPVKINIDAKNKEAHHEFEYHLLADDTYMIDGYLGTGMNVVIPATINNKPVTAIAEKAFYEKDIQSVVIAESVFEIGESAFENCSLKSVEILPHNDILITTSIGKNAFSYCSFLENVILPSTSYIEIGAEAFFRCSSLKRIELMSIESVGEKAFSESGLQSVNLHTGDTNPAIFANCKGLKEVTLGNFVDISDKMFMGCSSLETVTWDFSPYMDNKIGNKAFYECKSLKQFNLAGVFTVTSPKGINECIAELKDLGAKDVVIGTDAFAGCEKFKDPEPITPPKPVVPKATLDTNNVTVNEDGQYMTVPFKTDVSFDSKTKYYLRIYFSDTEGKIGELRYDESFNPSEKSLDLKLYKGMNCYTIQFYSDEAIGEYSNTIEWYYEPIIKPKIQRYTHTFTISGYSELFEIIPDYTIAEEAIQRGEEPKYFEFKFKYTCPRCGTTSLHNGFYRMKYSSDGTISVMGYCTKRSCSSIPGIAVSIDYHAVKVS